MWGAKPKPLPEGGQRVVALLAASSGVDIVV